MFFLLEYRCWLLRFKECNEKNPTGLLFLPVYLSCRFSDGQLECLFADGSTQIIFANGIRKVVGPRKDEKIIFPDGQCLHIP